jgi:hypothetical protein
VRFLLGLAAVFALNAALAVFLGHLRLDLEHWLVLGLVAVVNVGLIVWIWERDVGDGRR